MFKRRTIIIGFLFTLAFFFLISRLWYLQVYRADYYRKMGEKRIHRLRPLPPSRGTIFDRRGRVLAEDVASFDLWLQLARYKKIAGERRLVSNIDVIKIDELYDLLTASGTDYDLKFKVMKKDLTERSEFVDRLCNILQQEAEDVVSLKNRVVDSILAVIGRVDVTNKNGVYKSRKNILHNLTDPIRMLRDISISAYEEIEQLKINPYTEEEMIAVEPRGGYKRIYPFGELMGHITGYTGNLNKDEYTELRGYWDDDNSIVEGKGVIKKSGRIFFQVDEGSEEEEMIRPRIRRREGKQYYISGGSFTNEMVGRSGIEQWYNQDLRGEHVWRVEKLVKLYEDGPRVFVNAGMRREAVNGENITLTIDVEFQQEVQDILYDEVRRISRMSKHRKALNKHEFTEFPATVLVMNVNNGEIYAMVSLPGFDPNKIHEAEYYKQLVEDNRYPLYNRAISGIIKGGSPAGSTIKPLVGLAALEEGKITAQTHFLCEGALHIGDREYVCMNRAHHGSIDVTDALKVSCNIFFYRTGEALGGKLLAKWLRNFGLGVQTGIDLPRERAGHLPEHAFTGRGWSLGESYYMGIGQGAIDVTPVQLATAYAAIATGGNKIRPHLKFDPSDPFLNEPVARMSFSKKNVEIIKKGMWKVVQISAYPRGTAYRLGHIDGFEYIGKTGSAEAGVGRQKDTHASFIALAPYEEPEIVVAALMPYADHGGDSCSQLVKRIIKAYFQLDSFDDIDNEKIDTDQEYDFWNDDSIDEAANSDGTLG